MTNKRHHAKKKTSPLARLGTIPKIILSPCGQPRLSLEGITAEFFPLLTPASITHCPQMQIPGALLMNIMLVSACVPGNPAGNRHTSCLKPLTAHPYLLSMVVTPYSVALWIQQNFPAETASFSPFQNIHPIIIIYGLLFQQEALRRVSSNGALPWKLTHRSRQKLSGVCSQI